MPKAKKKKVVKAVDRAGRPLEGVTTSSNFITKATK